MNRVLRRAITLVVFLALFTATLPSSAAAATPSWKYTALGDSLGTGFGAARGYVPRYQDYVATDARVRVSLTNLSQNGWTSGDLLYALRTNRTFRKAVSGAQVVTWDIGGNDLRAARNSYKAGTCGGADDQECLRTTVEAFNDNWVAIIAEIRALRSTSPTIIRTMNIYNPYVREDSVTDSSQKDGGLNDFHVFRSYLKAANDHIAATARQNSIPYADVYLAFNGQDGDQDPANNGYLFLDGLHPNDTGHKVIADLLRGLGYAPLR